MAVYRYNITVKVNKNDDVNLNIVHASPGTASFHLIDLPGVNDLESTNETELCLGKGLDLLSERTIIYSKAVNMDENNNDVSLTFIINGNEVVKHSNPKDIDPSPQIKININFTEL